MENHSSLTSLSLTFIKRKYMKSLLSLSKLKPMTLFFGRGFSLILKRSSLRLNGMSIWNINFWYNIWIGETPFIEFVTGNPPLTLSAWKIWCLKMETRMPICFSIFALKYLSGHYSEILLSFQHGRSFNLETGS